MPPILGSMRPLRTRSSALALIALVAVASCANAPPEPTKRRSIPPLFAEPTASPARSSEGGSGPLGLVGDIVFVSDRDGQGIQLYAMDPSGRHTTMVTSGGETVSGAAFRGSPPKTALKASRPVEITGLCWT